MREEIEGLIGGYEKDEDHLSDDIHPEATLVKFFSERVELGFDEEGKPKFRDDVFVEMTKHLGHTKAKKKVHDTLRRNSETGRWEILKLLPGEVAGTPPMPLSWIKRYKDEWNAFNRGQSADPAGVPLKVLFRADPSRAEFYERYGVFTIEQLVGSESSAHVLGMGALDDISKGKRYLQKMKENAPGLAAMAALEAKDRELEDMRARMAQLEARVYAAPPAPPAPVESAKVKVVKEKPAQPTPPPQKKKRHRRTKAEIEAARRAVNTPSNDDDFQSMEAL